MNDNKEELEKKNKQDETTKNVNQGDEVIELKKELATIKASIEEKDDRYKRIMAEFENYKKRSAKERETLYNSIISENSIFIFASTR